MNVLHVTLSLSPGGRREAIATLCAGLAEHGVQNHLCCLDCLGASEETCAASFVHTINLQRRRLLDYTALRRLRRFCRQHDIEILHSHDAASQAMCALAMPGRRRPLLMSFHRSRNFECARPRDRLRNALAGLRTGAVVTASTERAHHYRNNNHVADHKVLVVPHGIDLTRFQPDPSHKAHLQAQLNIPNESLLVGVIGHFGLEKGVDVAIDAFQRMCRQRPRLKAHLIVLGTGSARRKAYMDECIDPALAGRIHLVGFQDQPQQWTRGFDVLLHAARAEAFGLVLVEAMACAVPVIAPAVGGIPDIVRDGECGRLVDRPDPDLLAAALGDVLDDDDERKRLAQGAVLRARSEYGQARCAGRFLELYRDLLAHRPRQRQPEQPTS